MNDVNCLNYKLWKPNSVCPCCSRTHARTYCDVVYVCCIYIYMYAFGCPCFHLHPHLMFIHLFLSSQDAGWEGGTPTICWVNFSCGDKDPHLPKVRWHFIAQFAWGVCHLRAACAQSEPVVDFHLDFWLQQFYLWCGSCHSDLCQISWLTWNVSFYVVDTVDILCKTSGFNLQCLRQWLHFWTHTVRFECCDLVLSFTWTDLKLL